MFGVGDLIAVADLPERRRVRTTAGDLAGSYCGPDQHDRRKRVRQLAQMYAEIAAEARLRVQRTGCTKRRAVRETVARRTAAGLPASVSHFAPAVRLAACGAGIPDDVPARGGPLDLGD